MDLWSVRLVLIHLHPHQLHHPYLLQQQLLEPRVSVLSFQPWCFFFGGLPFALLALQCRAPFSSLSFSKYVVRVAFLFGPLAPRLAASAFAHLSGNWTVPWPLFLRLTASAGLCSTRPASPPDPLENHLIWVDSIKVCCRMSLECLVGTRKFPTTLVTLSLHL